MRRYVYDSFRVITTVEENFEASLHSLAPSVYDLRIRRKVLSRLLKYQHKQFTS